jgi:hypothetical protein
MAKKYCQNCDNEVLTSIRMCPKCGSKDIGDTVKQEYISKDDYKKTSSSAQSNSQPSSSSYSYSAHQSFSANPNSESFIEKFLAIGGGALAMIFFFGFGFLQIVAGYIGIEHEFGSGWAFAAIALFILLRISLPLMIGMFFCALNVWGWHWFWALAFTAPVIIFLIPGMIAAMIDAVKR